ncbi:MAG TPA: PQQ-dependent sugar dehydrogenase [Tepidisphaeraceae bacterium]|nr:PQQ-dependent sugar dehydrogenase [Tepidisphaeraceae bacterium]
MLVRSWFAIGLVLCLATVADAQHQDLLPNAIQPGTTQVALQPVMSGLTAPVYGISAPGDSSDLFVVDQAGKIDIIHNGVPQPTPFLDVSGLESAVPLKPGYDERGLLGLAFSPGFNDPKSVGYRTVYTYQSEATGTAPADFAPAPGTLTGPIDHQNVLVQWKVSASNPNVIDPTTRRDLLREDHPALNHNGGTIAFGPDGDLYLAIGDGGTANDSGNGHIVSTGNAQSLSVIMGKMLRIDVNGTNSANGRYGIPADNPFVNTSGAAKEIYALGLRNPYKFSFDAPTGKLVEGDVGQNQVEEVNTITKGGNYGWPIKEGTFLFNRTGTNVGTVNPVSSPGSPAGLIDPLLEYDHNSGSAVVGGFVYHGSLIPQLDGKYIFGDFSNGSFSAPGNGRLFYADLASGQIDEFAMSNPLNLWLKGFGEDANGEIYVMASQNLGPTGSTGVVFELTPEPSMLGLWALAPLALLHRFRKKTGAIDASAAAVCSASIRSVCLGARGSHLMAKKAMSGICPAMSNCQIWATAPSSGSWTTPATAIAPSNNAKAASDIATGRNALGCLMMAPKERGACIVVTR